jgi:hypothetical protein
MVKEGEIGVKGEDKKERIISVRNCTLVTSQEPDKKKIDYQLFIQG